MNLAVESGLALKSSYPGLPEVERPERESAHSSWSVTEVKNAWAKMKAVSSSETSTVSTRLDGTTSHHTRRSHVHHLVGTVCGDILLASSCSLLEL